jgi:hypothetical protein
LKTGVSASIFKRWLAAGAELQATRRFALLCGHPRSGTILLEQVFDAHPDIVATDETSILLGEAYSTLSGGFAERTPTVEILESASIDALQRARGDYIFVADLHLPTHRSPLQWRNSTFSAAC